MLKLTPRQAEILAFIKRCLDDNGYPPTRAEIALELGFKSPNAAEEHLKALARKGAIEMTPGASRGIRIPGFEAKADESTLPIIGRVAAGAPILAQQHVEESCNINPTFFHPRADYLLRVHGMSMKDVGIFDGDLLAGFGLGDRDDIGRISNPFDRGGHPPSSLADSEFGPSVREDRPAVAAQRLVRAPGRDLGFGHPRSAPLGQ